MVGFEGPLRKVEKAPGIQWLLIRKWIWLYKVVMVVINKTQWLLNGKTITLLVSNPSPTFFVLLVAWLMITWPQPAQCTRPFRTFHPMFEMFVIPFSLPLQLCKVYAPRDSSVWTASREVCFHPFNVKFSSPGRDSRKRPSLQSGVFEAPSPVNVWDDMTFKNRMSVLEMSKWKQVTVEVFLIHILLS